MYVLRIHLFHPYIIILVNSIVVLRSLSSIFFNFIYWKNEWMNELCNAQFKDQLYISNEKWRSNQNYLEKEFTKTYTQTHIRTDKIKWNRNWGNKRALFSNFLHFTFIHSTKHRNKHTHSLLEMMMINKMKISTWFNST